MDEKVKKKWSKIDGSNSGSSFELESNKGQKKKHKERKKKHGTDEILNLSEALEENCTGEAAERQTCYIEQDITFTRNKGDESHINKRKKKKGRKDIEVINDNVSDDKKMQFLDGNQQRKMKKRKDCDDSLAGMQEMSASKPSKKGRMTRDNEFKSNEGDHSFVTEKEQGKKMKIENLRSKKGKRAEDEDYKTREGDPCLANSNVVDPSLVKSNEGDQHLVKNNEGKDDDQGKKMMKKKKKLSEKSKLEKNNELNGGDQHLAKSNEGEDDDQGKKMKKKKISSKRKSKEINDFKSNEGYPPLARFESGDTNECCIITEVDDQGKKMKVKKKIKASKSESLNPASGGTSKSKRVTFSDQVEVFGDGLVRGKRFTPEGDQHLAKSNEGEDDHQCQKMKKKKISGKRKNKEINDFKSNEGYPPLARTESGDANERCIVTEVDDQGKKMKVKKKNKASTNESPNPASGGTSKSKRVTFSDQVEDCCDDLVRGKRFTPEEDEKIKEAVLSYIESHGLGAEGRDMIMHCKSHPEVRDCWKEITAALPHRPHQSVYYRAHILFEFERDGNHKWTPEELEFIRNVHEQHGSDWKSVAEALGKNRFHVKDAWRRVKLTNTNTGHWSQEEYQNLFDLVNLDLRLRALEESRQSKHGMLRDNISWEAIASKLETRTSQRCCKKWYEQLTSPMVADGIWSDTDDYCLLNALFTLDACCFEEVEWDDLLEHRSGDVCRKRWNQMVRYIGEHVGKSFAEQVEILAKRFCPDLLEAREAFDSKPVVG